MIKAGKAYRSTTRLLFARLGFGAIVLGAAGILYAIFMVVGVLLQRTDMNFLLFLLWVPCAIALTSFLRRQVCYRVLAGYAAVANNIIVTGKAPQNMSESSLRAVASRFDGAAAYARYRRSVTGSLRQILKTISFKRRKKDGSYVSEYTEFFTRLSVMWLLSYLKYCVVGYTFYRYDQNSAQSAADGIAIYYCAHKKLNKYATPVVLYNLTFLIAGCLLFSVPCCALFSVFDWSGFLAVLLALGIAWMFKFAFLDSFLIIYVMRPFMDAVNTTPIPNGLHAYLSKRSSTYRSLYRRGQKLAADSNFMDELYGSAEMPAANDPLPGTDDEADVSPQEIDDYQPEYASAVTTATLTKVERGGSNPYAQYDLSNPADRGRPVYCMNCGAKNFPGAQICINCGETLK